MSRRGAVLLLSLATVIVSAGGAGAIVETQTDPCMHAVVTSNRTDTLKVEVYMLNASYEDGHLKVNGKTVDDGSLPDTQGDGPPPLPPGQDDPVKLARWIVDQALGSVPDNSESVIQVEVLLPSNEDLGFAGLRVTFVVDTQACVND